MHDEEKFYRFKGKWLSMLPKEGVLLSTLVCLSPIVLRCFLRWRVDLVIRWKNSYPNSRSWLATYGLIIFLNIMALLKWFRVEKFWHILINNLISNIQIIKRIIKVKKMFHGFDEAVCELLSTLEICRSGLPRINGASTSHQCQSPQILQKKCTYQPLPKNILIYFLHDELNDQLTVMLFGPALALLAPFLNEFLRYQIDVGTEIS